MSTLAAPAAASFRVRAFLALAAGCVAWTEATAQPAPLTEETMLNETAPALAVDVAAGADRHTLAVWEREGSVLGRRFDPELSPLGTEIEIVPGGRSPKVAALSDGGFAVVWLEYDDIGAVIAGRVLDSDGEPRGDPIVIDNDHSIDELASGPVKTQPDVSATGDGFVVAWSSGAFYLLDEYRVYSYPRVRRFDSEGEPVGTEASLPGLGDEAHTPAVASDAAGNFVVVWSAGEYFAGSSTFGVFGQRFGADGVELGSAFAIGDGGLRGVAVGALADGDFAVAWSTYELVGGIYGEYPSPSDVVMRRFDASGTALGTALALNPPGSTADSPAVAASGSDHFLVAWQSSDEMPGPASDGSGSGVLARALRGDGVAVGTEFFVNGYATGDQGSPSVSAAGDGFVVAWDTSAASDDVSGRAFELASTCFTAGETCEDDGDACTDDVCDEAGRCTHPFNTAPCDDAVACTVSDACSEGVCGGTPDCDDPEFCNPAAGACDLCGDASGDARVTVADALLALRAALGLGVCTPADPCDVDCGRDVNLTDAMLILTAAVDAPAAGFECVCNGA